ncbi:hypothetical protein [Epilithonimonas sp.]|uniref:hypothetical protein n=1 Tax=Epilithonimonas sp. TaxID=2894511 RepID=UPI0035B471F0
MKAIKLGDLYSLKNHPYESDANKIKISALASMTPPILVVSEIQNSPNQYDSDTGIAKAKQIKCIYYSHKNHKFEESWFDLKLLKPINKIQVEENNGVNPEKQSKDEDKNEFLEDNGEIRTVKIAPLQYNKSLTIDSIKETFLHKQVILKSCDLELGKIKTTYSESNNLSQKLTAHLDFLPPVLTVIDVKINEEKIGYNPKTGNLKKISSVYILKCKWYNPLSGSFSEDFIPIETLKIVEPQEKISLIAEIVDGNTFLRKELNNKIILENGITLTHTYIKPLEIIFNHYKYKVKYYDFFREKYSETDLSNLHLDDDTANIEELIVEKVPSYNSSSQTFTSVENFAFTKGNYYRITYKDLQDRITKRVIYVKEFIPKIVLIADCLLRKGEERHFRIKDAILKIEVLDSKYFNPKSTVSIPPQIVS